MNAVISINEKNSVLSIDQKFIVCFTRVQVLVSIRALQ
jgi:hypothetical protein